MYKLEVRWSLYKTRWPARLTSWDVFYEATEVRASLYLSAETRGSSTALCLWERSRRFLLATQGTTACDMIYDMIWYDMVYDMIYLLAAIGLSPGGSSTVHIYTQTVHRKTQNKQYIEQHNNLEECGPCPVLASCTVAFALKLRKKQGKTSVRVAASKNT